MTKGPLLEALRKKTRRRPTLPPGDPSSTIGAGGLNYSVRNGKRCFPSAMTTGKSWVTVMPHLGAPSLLLGLTQNTDSHANHCHVRIPRAHRRRIRSSLTAH